MYEYNSELLKNSQALRKNMTPEEKQLWYHLLSRFPVSVKRQKVIGRYILDFYIPRYKTAIEIDGLQHTSPENRVNDAQRDEYLWEQGIKVLRYRNHDINTRFNFVADDIMKKVGITVKDLKPKQ